MTGWRMEKVEFGIWQGGWRWRFRGGGVAVAVAGVGVAATPAGDVARRQSQSQRW